MANNSLENIVSKLESKIDAQNTKYNVSIGILSALLIVATAGRFVE